MINLDFDKEISSHIKEVLKLQTPTGLFTASAANVSTGYDKAWLRDVYFMTLAFQETTDWEPVQKAAKALLGILCKHKEKINWATRNKPHESWQYIHARFNPETFDEYWEEWGNKQNDAVGEVLFLIASCEVANHSVVESDDEKKMVQMLVDYINNVEYWHDPDSGIWEEAQEVHASSIGAVVAALKLADKLDFVTVPEGSIQKGEDALRALLPRESESKFCDLALLTLIYPFKVTTPEETTEILKNIEYFNTRDLGVIRYRGDKYYNDNKDGYSEEAEWSMGHAWLSIIYAELGNKEKAVAYLKKAQHTVNADGKIPELYFSHSERSNENIPLGWAESMYVVALVKVQSLLKE